MGISLESDPFLMSRFFISLKNILFLSKRLRTVTILEWFSNLAIIDSTFLLSEEEVGRRFSLIPRFFYNVDKKLVECFIQFSFFLNNFCGFNLSYCYFSISFYYQKLASPSSRTYWNQLNCLCQYSHSSVFRLFLINIHKHFFVVCICTSILLFYLLKTFLLILIFCDKFRVISS